MPERNEIVEIVKRAHDQFARVFTELYSDLTSADGPLKSQSLDVEDMADIGFFCREMESLADDLRKECKARKELAGKLLCLNAVENDDASTIHGEFCTATTDGGLVPRMPNPGTEPYEQLLDYLGIKDSHGGLVRFHWKTLKEWMEQAAAEGKRFPVSIETSPEFKSTFRRKQRK